jgi:adenylate cyclase
LTGSASGSRLGLNAATLSVLGILLCALLFRAHVPLLDLIELRTYDLRFLSRGAREVSPAVALAVIDEKSLDALGRWPWPRSRFAELVDALSRDGARVIGFDIGFFEPDENSELAFARRLGETLDTLAIDDARLRRIVGDAEAGADHDAALAAAMRRSTAPIVLGYFFHMQGAGAGPRLDAPEIERRLAAIRSSQFPLVLEEDPDRRPPIPTALAPEVNLPALAEASAASGYFDVREDRDGVVRWMPLVIQAGDALFPPLAISMVWQALGKPRLQLEIGREGVRGIQVGPRFVPTDERGRLLIDYAGPARSFPHYSISDILAGSLPEGTFRDRLVLVGATATGLHDARSTPFGNVFPGPGTRSTTSSPTASSRGPSGRASSTCSRSSRSAARSDCCCRGSAPRWEASPRSGSPPRTSSSRAGSSSSTASGSTSSTRCSRSARTTSG